MPIQRIGLFLIAAAIAGLATALAATLAAAPPRGHLLEASLTALGWGSLAALWLAHARLAALVAHRGALAAQFTLGLAAAIGFPAGLAVVQETGSAAVLHGATLAWLAGAVLFAARLAALALPRRAAA